MKISKYLLVAAASVMLFSCAKDDNNGSGSIIFKSCCTEWC